MEGKFLANIGNVYRDQGKLEQSLEMFEKAVRIYRKTLGPETAEVARALINMGHTLQQQTKHQEAMAKYHQGLAIFRSALGGEHDLVAGTLHSMAVCSLRMGDKAGALEFVREAHSMFTKMGLSHGQAQQVATILEALERTG
mmetsp:Transcript_16824/g.33167  ORF Transcript_16824/g.33167 Transcript_16824/m.33167 type:complete len:142 (+) Transcript_16824:530-955(+)